MMDRVKYICSFCGQQHEDWPALAYSSPAPYNDLNKEERKDMAELSGDFCIIRYPDQTDRFIRCTLTQRVIGHCTNLNYGFWVTLSERSFQDYSDNFDNENHEVQYFGWLASRFSGYTFDENIPTTVFIRPGNKRPEIVPHEDFDHPFVKDYYNGITKEEAERRVKEMIESVGRMSS